MMMGSEARDIVALTDGAGSTISITQKKSIIGNNITSGILELVVLDIKK